LQVKSSHQIRVAVAGARGKMGQEAVAAIRSDPRFALTSVLLRDLGQAHEFAWDGCTAYDDSTQLLSESHPDVWLDLTDATSVKKHVEECITFGVSPVIGATGYTQADIERWDRACLQNELGAIAVPNFAVGALLMMRFAAEAARFLKNVEIIEMHHDGKKDAPSGTAKRTAEAIAANQDAASTTRPQGASFQDMGASSTEQATLARGYAHHDIPIHSIRLPGLVAHQEVIFGGGGETLTIRHDSLSRASFMPGILLACSRVKELKGLVYGLDNLLW
jgi:4-hydroxy-tetrahydrodipicolinate reductase